MSEPKTCCSPGCNATLKRGYLCCRHHWERLSSEARSKARHLLVYDRDRYAAQIYLQDEFERMKGDQPWR